MNKTEQELQPPDVYRTLVNQMALKIAKYRPLIERWADSRNLWNYPEVREQAQAFLKWHNDVLKVNQIEAEPLDTKDSNRPLFDAWVRRMDAIIAEQIKRYNHRLTYVVDNSDDAIAARARSYSGALELFDLFENADNPDFELDAAIRAACKEGYMMNRGKLSNEDYRNVLLEDIADKVSIWLRRLKWIPVLKIAECFNNDVANDARLEFKWAEDWLAQLDKTKREQVSELVCSIDAKRILVNGKVVILKRDGAAWCAHADDFINVQESVCGFGKTQQEALVDFGINLGKNVRV